MEDLIFISEKHATGQAISEQHAEALEEMPCAVAQPPGLKASSRETWTGEGRTEDMSA